MVKPVTSIGDVPPTFAPAAPEPRQVAVYRMMGLPPSSAGAVKATLSFASPRPTTGAGGASGADTKGVTSEEGGEGALVPNAFVAVTVHV